ncbi:MULTISPECIES: hypothetical protein [Streptococcus]|uniref:hypothetical protein n=1 Tax=Streptococcus TaxID=1301 RepID=UPI001CEC288F|nr:hypothetical protein [Streptococcus pseudopneumoniae]
MKIKEQTRKLAAGCSKHCFEVVDKTDEVSHIYTARRRWRGLKRFSKSIEVLIIFVTTILAPLLITITGNVISEWIVRKWLDKRDKKI